MKEITKSVEIDGKSLVFETGKIAKQAAGSTVVRMGDTMVLVTACASPDPRPGVDFLPLTVDYRERLGAAGKFPGGFRKREGAPNQKEILTMRNIDRPLRPLFPVGYQDEVQIQCWVLAADGQNEPDVLAGINLKLLSSILLCGRIRAPSFRLTMISMIPTRGAKNILFTIERFSVMRTSMRTTTHPLNTPAGTRISLSTATIS